MATIATVPNEVPGNFNTAALFNLMGGITNYLLAPVRFKGYSATAQAVLPGTTPIPLTLDTELYDSDGGHSTVTNTSRYTAVTPGLMRVTGSVCFSNAVTVGTRTICVLLNGVIVAGSMFQMAASGAANGVSVQTSIDVQVAVGDYVEIAVWQNGTTGTTTLPTTATSNLGLSSTMSLYRISS